MKCLRDGAHSALITCEKMLPGVTEGLFHKDSTVLVKLYDGLTKICKDLHTLLGRMHSCDILMLAEDSKIPSVIARKCSHSDAFAIMLCLRNVERILRCYHHAFVTGRGFYLLDLRCLNAILRSLRSLLAKHIA